MSEFSLADMKLFFVLADACKYESEVKASNVELMKATGLDDRSLRRARMRLTDEFKVIGSKPADGRKESYVYSVSRSGGSLKHDPAETQPAPEKGDPTLDTVLIPATDELMRRLSIAPSLEGKPRS